MLEALSNQPIIDAEGLSAILKGVIEILPEFRPKLFGSTEPLTHRWYDEVLKDLSPYWPAITDLGFEAENGGQGMIDTIRGNHIHSTVFLRCRGVGPDDVRAEQFLNYLVDEIGVEFGFAHYFNAQECGRAEVRGTLQRLKEPQPWHFLVTSHHLIKCIPDLYWCTVFGPRYRDVLTMPEQTDCPGTRVTTLAGGHFQVKISQSSADIRESPEEFDSKRDCLKRQLDERAFCDPKSSTSRIAPVFDDSIARSLRRQR